MIMFEKIKTTNIDELVEMLDKYSLNEHSPWFEWWDRKYCDNCIAEIAYNPEIGRDLPHGWCELHQNCRYFPELDDIPNSKQIIKMWLESEAD